jgi:hypothetical protein
VIEKPVSPCFPEAKFAAHQLFCWIRSTTLLKWTNEAFTVSSIGMAAM